MDPRAVRFSDAAWAMVREEALLEGVSASQFVREAAIAQVYFQRGRRTGEVEALPEEEEEEDGMKTSPSRWGAG